MERKKSNAENSTFGGTLNDATNSASTNVPRDGSTTGSMVGSILSGFQVVQESYKKLGHSYCAFSSANARNGERMPVVVNSSTQNLIPEQQATHEELGHRFGAIFSANAASGERMTNVVNSSTQTPIPEREGDLEEDKDDGQDRNMENMFSEALMEHHMRINVELRVRAFYLSIKMHKYKSPKSTCLESKEHCYICLDVYHDGQELAKIECGHVYHFE
ncbi:hypothetical protein CQW23_30767 [Capsicum baccatum]|uniref:Uncharacterized protein n=1 Tax=Capsicum baccatum TaxID=33114 RepID=A0A2G2V9G7_CAPBA|nr:hypothetical protein CQW23_30767 [Capsicum baccatum]